jgi:RNA polymerase sigma-70 factor (ECF subfamily)
MEVMVASKPDSSLDTAARQDWLARCQAAYATVYRGLVAMGATRDDAADALQDAFEDALRQRAPVARPEGWLFVVAQRKWRRTRWRRRLFRPLELARGSLRSDRDEEIDLLNELGRLTERQRTVIIARYVLGLSQREIAGLLGIAPGTVAATVHQATALLRERLIGGAK